MPLIVHSLYFLGLGRLRLGRLNQQCLMFPILKRTSHLLMVKSPFWMVTLCLLLKMTIEIVGFPIDSMVMFHSYVNVYQRVNPPLVGQLSQTCGHGKTTRPHYCTTAPRSIRLFESIGFQISETLLEAETISGYLYLGDQEIRYPLVN